MPHNFHSSNGIESNGEHVNGGRLPSGSERPQPDPGQHSNPIVGNRMEDDDSDDSDTSTQVQVFSAAAAAASAPVSQSRADPVVLDLDDSDSDPENENQETASHAAAATTRRGRNEESRSSRRRSKRTSTRISYADCFDSGDELVVETPQEKKIRLAQEPKEIRSLDLFAEELASNPRKAKSRRNLIIKAYEVNLVHYINLFKECGKYLNELSIGTSSPALLKLIGSNCPKLTTLTIRKSEDEDSKYPYSIMDARKVNQTNLGLCNLKRLNIGVNPSFNVETELEMICQESKQTLQEFRFTFRHLRELDQVLRILNKCTWLRKLKKLELDMIQENGALAKKHFAQLTQLPFKLEAVEVVAGIWEDFRRFEGISTEICSIAQMSSNSWK